MADTPTLHAADSGDGLGPDFGFSIDTATGARIPWMATVQPNGLGGWNIVDNDSPLVSILKANSGVIIGAVEQSGTWNINNVSGVVSLPTGAATEVTLDAVKTAIEGTLTVGTHAVTQSGTWTVDLGLNNDVTLAVLPDTAAGDLAAMVVDLAAIEALLTTIDADTSKIPSLGQAVMAASAPVVIASDQSDIPITLDGESVAVTGTFWQATQPVSAVSLPLPTGAATEVTLGSIETLLAGTLTVDGSGVTQPISVVSLPLPTGAATATLQGTANSALAAIQTAVEALDNAVATISTTDLLRVAVFDDSDTQVTNFSGGGGGGDATAANQVTMIGHLSTIAGDTTSLDSKDFATQTTLATLLTEGQFDSVVGNVSVTPTANTVLGRLKDIDDALNGTITVDGSGVTQPISAASLPLPTGAATAANQTTAIGHLNTLAGTVSGTEVQTDIVAPLPAGTNVIGDVGINSFPTGLIDSFGHIVTGTIRNQVDVQFYRGTPATLMTESTAGTGSTGATGGMATFSTGASAGGSASADSTTTTTYTAGAEMYCLFTAAFTGTGSSDTFQRIGLYDNSDGFFIGDEGGTFGVSVRKGTSDSQVAKGSFNLDTLTGASDSKFTRAGTPEAIDLTKLNVWRIRFGWVGSAPIKFEVLSPDGEWVTFHEIRQPNNAAVPSIENADLPVRVEVDNNSVATTLTLLTNCLCAGTTQALSTVDSTITADTLVETTRSVITGETTGGGGGFVNVKVSPSGALSADVSGTVDVGDITGTVSLPTGAATETTLASIDGKDFATETTLASVLTSVQLIDDPVATIGTTPLQRVAIFDAADTQITSFGGGTQYTEGDTDASITGTAVMWEDAADTLRAASVSKPLPVRLSDGSDECLITAGGLLKCEITSGFSSVMVSDNAGNNWDGGLINSDNVLSSVYAHSVRAHGYVYDGSGWDMARGDATNGTLVNLGANNDVTITSGTITTITNDVSIDDGGNSITVDDGGGSITVDGSVSLAADPDVNMQVYNGASWGNAWGTTVSDTLSQSTVIGQFMIGWNMLYNGSSWDRWRGDTTGANMQGNEPHDDPDTGNPLKIGAKAVDFDSSATVADGDRTNLVATRRGVLMTHGSGPGQQCKGGLTTAAQTDLAMVSCSTGQSLCVKRITVTASNANTVDVDFKIGFATATLATGGTTGASGLLHRAEGIPPGGGFTIGNGGGDLGTGGEGEDIRYTCTVPTGGSISISVTYCLIEVN